MELIWNVGSHAPCLNRCAGRVVEMAYDPMDRPDRNRGLRNGSTFYSVVVSWFSRTYELEVLVARPLTVVFGVCLRARVAPFALVGPAVQGRAATSFGMVGTTVAGEGGHLRRGRKRPP